MGFFFKVVLYDQLIHFKEQKFTLFLIFPALVVQNDKTILQCSPQQGINTNQVTLPLPPQLCALRLDASPVPGADPDVLCSPASFSGLVVIS